MIRSPRLAPAVLLTLIVCLLVAPRTAYAYGGPGSVLTAIGAFLAVIAALFATMFGFVWYPLKRLYRKLRSDRVEPTEPVK